MAAPACSRGPRGRLLSSDGRVGGETVTDPAHNTVTRLLLEWRAGSTEALSDLMPRVYDELRRLARRFMSGERGDHTLQTTALVHEAYVHLVQADLSFRDRAHFFAVAARQMRRILVDHARARRSAKRGGGVPLLSIDETRALDPARPLDVLDLDAALLRLAANDRRKAETVELRFFGGMTHEEIAEALAVSVSTVRQDLRVAKAWLLSELEEEAANGP
jgi:RNA polymerase sigma factor (TIGR02999 family)